jgi:hypothetical protein
MESSQHTEPTIPPTRTEQTQPINSGPGCLIRILYFLVIGLWVGGVWTIIAWVLNLTVIGLPAGLWMLNRLPQVMTLKPRPAQIHVTTTNGTTTIRRENQPQAPFILRALYFLLIGWWFSLIWLLSAWLLTGLSLGLGLPLAFWMFDRTPAITTLARM